MRAACVTGVPVVTSSSVTACVTGSPEKRSRAVSSALTGIDRFTWNW